MNNKVLVKIIIPEIEETYDVFLPINLKVGNIIKKLGDTICEISDNSFVNNNKRCLYNRYTGFRYEFNSLIAETDIRNDSILILI